MTDRLSEFGSGISMSKSNYSNEDSEEDLSLKTVEKEFKTVNERKRTKKQKRKLKISPGKEEFLKKPNIMYMGQQCKCVKSGIKKKKKADMVSLKIKLWILDRKQRILKFKRDNHLSKFF